MRILHAISSVNPALGGPAEAVRQLGLLACREGHSVDVVTLDAPRDPWIADFPLPLHALGGSRFGYRYSSYLKPWLTTRAEEFDAVVVHGLWQFIGFGTRQVMQQKRRPYVVYTHGMLDPWFKQTYPLKHLKKCLYWPWGEYRVLRDAAAVLFTCETERLLARESFKLYRAKERVVRFGTARPTGDPASQRSAFLRAFPSLAGGPFLLFLGRVTPKKGVDVLIRAFAQSCGADPALKLAIAGPAPTELRMQLHEFAVNLGISDRIVWTGMLEGDQKWGAYHACQVFVLPSHQENFGISVAEALACAKPVLISDKVNIWREVSESGGGLVAPDTVEGTAQMVRKWISTSSEEKNAYEQRALNCFERHFEINSAAASLMAVLKDVGLESLTHAKHSNYSSFRLL